MFRVLAHGLEILQVLLHLEGQEECELVLILETLMNEPPSTKKFVPTGMSLFHSRVGENDQLENFEISNIGLPPAPLFADKMAPSL